MPRLILLSATLGGVEHFQQWLAPCDLVATTNRHLPLQREILSLNADDDTESILQCEVSASLSSREDTYVLIFVYQTRSAEALALRFKDSGIDALPYHSRLSPDNDRVPETALYPGHAAVLSRPRHWDWG